MPRWRTALTAASTAAITLALIGTAQADWSYQGATHASFHAACGPVSGLARCHLDVVDNSRTAQPQSTTSSGPYRPSDLQAAYGLTGLSPAGTPTVAIVDAYDNPNVASDLATYRAEWGLPACGTGCFTKIDQSGGTNYPAGNSGWGEEIDLDVQMVSAICAKCNILLVEANSASFSDLAAAEDTAAGWPGVAAISNSYGGKEFSGETTYESHYDHPGIAITVSSGDNGYGVEYPAASQWVTAVGGTSLTQTTSSSGPATYSETAWSGAGSGCSAYITVKPALQPSIGTCTNRRIVADVSADANPNTGVYAYDTYGVTPGWYEFGGTSVASPIIASVYAVAGTGNTGTAYNALPYVPSAASALRDVTSGSNGRCTSRGSTANAALCTAVVGYDGPTGMGTPQGLRAF
jgi:subtilase family serine protease